MSLGCVWGQPKIVFEFPMHFEPFEVLEMVLRCVRCGTSSSFACFWKRNFPHSANWMGSSLEEKKVWLRCPRLFAPVTYAKRYENSMWNVWNIKETHRIAQKKKLYFYAFLNSAAQKHSHGKQFGRRTAQNHSNCKRFEAVSCKTKLIVSVLEPYRAKPR